MAFDVTPTSGDSPYEFTATFLNKGSFATGLYILEYRTATTAGSCPASAMTGTSNPAAAATLLDTGSLTVVGGDVPAGSCRTYGLYVRLASDSSIVSSSMATVNNV